MTDQTATDSEAQADAEPLQAEEQQQEEDEPKVVVQDPPTEADDEKQGEVNDATDAGDIDTAAETETQPINAAGNQSDLKPTKSTAEVEKSAAQINDDDDVVVGPVERAWLCGGYVTEGQNTCIWLLFTALYWTATIWIQVLLEKSFASAGFIVWCIGAIGLFSSSYTLYEGKYPSGATQEDPYQTNGIGRWTAFILTGTIIIDFCILAFVGMLNGTSAMPALDVMRGAGHFIHIFWTSLFYYNKFMKSNPDIATVAFFLEWFDMAVSTAVVFVLHNKEGGGEEGGCFDQAICIVYFTFVVLELFGWIFPMMLIESWGTEKNGRVVSTHLFFLDLTTDIMVMLAVLIEGSYVVSGLIMFDVIWKTFSVIRSFSYYLVYQIWLNKGQKVFKRGNSARN